MKFRSDLRQARERRFAPIVHIDDAVWRERLISLVLSAPPTTARLTIVAAPAGFGKTTMLAQLAHQADSNGVAVAWLNCDARDRDPDIFSENLLAALACSALSSKMKGGGQVSNVAALIAGIEQPTVIFIDEYEAASTALVDTVIEAVASAAPSNVSVVLASRENPHIPLTRLQLAGKIRIVDADLLRFSVIETRSLLQDYMPERAVQQVAAYADGWPFALQLARLRAAGGVLENWHLDAGAKMPRRQIFDYLAEEVFSTLKPETIAFLTEVAVLDALDVPSANAVRKRDDSLGFIQELFALKPIIVVDESNWSARLHPLLRDYLIDSLEMGAPGRRAELHLRAAHHLAERQRVYEAVEHAVTAGRLDVAAGMIEDAGAILVLLSEGGLRVRALLQQLPAATILRHPRLRLLQIGQQLALGLSTGLEFERIERLISENDTGPDDPARMELEVARCFILVAKSEQSLQFSPWAVLDSAKQSALARVANDRRPLCMCLAVEITMLHRYGPVDRCERRTAEIERIYRDSDYLTKPWVWMYQVRNAYARGELENAEQIIRRLLQQDVNFVHYRPQFIGQITTVVLGKISFQRGDVLEALAQFASVVPSESFNMFEIHVGALVEPAICESALGNAPHAIELLNRARHFAIEENLPHLAAIASATQLEMEVRFGEPANAALLAAAINLDELWLSARAPLALPWIEVEAIARARFFLQRHDNEPAAALDTADTLLGLSLTAGYHLSEITALVMRSYALRLLGRDQESRRDLQRALGFAQKCGVVQIFIGFGAEVMVQVRTLGEQSLGLASAWADHVVKTWESTFRVRSSATSAFTPRELDVLCELAKDQPTKMIAKTLMLSPETVKKHLKAIFVKLEVGKREDAVAQARRRALMP